MPSVRSASNPIVRAAFPLLIIFLACIFSGLLEKVPFLHYFHILTVIGGLALIAVGLGGRLPLVVVRSPIGRMLVIFTVWFILCVPFARWIGGSAGVLINIWSRSALAYVLVAGCILTIDQCKTVFKTIGYSVGVLSMLGVALRGYDQTGRLGLIGTRYENPNEFAWTLVLGLCFLSFLLLRGNGREKAIALLLSAPVLLALVKTGSRAGMIGFGMLAIFGFFQASRAMRAKLVVGVVLLMAVLVAVTPKELRSRYTTFFSAGQGTTSLEEAAVGSTQLRWTAFKDSVYLTLTHPVFGVGPGNFPVSQNELALARGEARGAWIVTHNTFTQVSSEMGIPGLIIYIVFIYQCFKPLNRIVRGRYPGRDWKDLRALAQTLRASLAILLTIALFDSYGYDTNIPIIAGLSCALSLIAQRRLRALSVPSPQVAPAASSQLEPAPEPAWMSFQ